MSEETNDRSQGAEGDQRRSWVPNRKQKPRKSKKEFDRKKMENLVDTEKPVYKGELEFYPIKFKGGYGIKGDVNNDGEITVADINALIDIIMGSPADAATLWRADVAEDGEIGLADVNALVDKILSM